MRAHGCCDGGASWCGEAGPEPTGECAHGKEEEAASLTGGGAGEERRRGGGATGRDGGGRRRAVAALQGGGWGRVRGEIEGRRREEAPNAKNRGGVHRRWRIDGGKELGR